MQTNNKYEQSRTAVDAVIFTIQDKQLQVLLHKREKEPFETLFELPGGLLLPTETADQTLKRKLLQTTGHDDIFFQQFFTFTKPNRDPRVRTISVGFIALINTEKIPDLTGWQNISDLTKLAFDHLNIIEKAKEYLKQNISPKIVKQFMPEFFPLNKLQEVYEVIEQKEYDNRNFRKKLISSGIVKETEKREINVSHRPAKLFCFI